MTNSKMPSPKLVHFTEGGPWFGHTRQRHVSDWFDEFQHLIAADNPKADVRVRDLYRLVEVKFDEQTK